MNRRRQIILGLLAVTASGLFVFSLICPYAVNPMTADLFSVWGESFPLAIVVGGVFIVLASIPFFFRRGWVSVLPFLGAMLVVGFALLITFMLILEGGEGVIFPTLCAFAGAGLALLAEAVMARRMV